MKPTQRPVPLQPQTPTAAAIRLDRYATVAQDLEIAIERAHADAKLGGNIRDGSVLTRLEKRLQLFQPAQP